MKQVYIINENHPQLLLFFAGWAADETPFKQYRPCLLYTSIIFAATIYLFNEQSNEKINLPARCRCRIRSL